ncbi:MAG: anthranilate/aminodeoxychorismate synthase component II [Deltaproteobacteria bacterium]|nr:MAG: anthranilate/aminodeoxychorismate synthase component II [Deltaproteobacteria bacterium]
MIVVVDNYDSFTYNLVQYLLELGAAVTVFRNDEITVEDLGHLGPEGILLSPGPGRPEGAGISLACVEHFSGRVPLLGVCLGHQTIAQAFGATVVRAGRLMHGRTSPVEHDGEGMFAGIPSPFTATRYHSLVVDRSTVPDVLVETAHTAEGELMGLRHREHPTFGVQFHPESFLTEHGHALLDNFLSRLPERGRRKGRPSRERVA